MEPCTLNLKWCNYVKTEVTNFCTLDSIVGDLEIFCIFSLNTVELLMTRLSNFSSEVTLLVKPSS